MSRMRLQACGAVLAAFTIASPARAAKAIIGQPAPDFQITTLDGAKLTLADFKGEVLVLNFWATWCGPCKRELPLLDRYYDIQQKFGLRVLAVTTEDSLPLSALRPLAKVMKIPMVRRMKGPYDYPDGVPTNYVIDRAGILRYAKAGAFSLDDMNAIFVPLLKAPAPEDAAPVVSGASTAPPPPNPAATSQPSVPSKAAPASAKTGV